MLPHGIVVNPETICAETFFKSRSIVLMWMPIFSNITVILTIAIITWSFYLWYCDYFRNYINIYDSSGYLVNSSVKVYSMGIQYDCISSLTLFPWPPSLSLCHQWPDLHLLLPHLLFIIQDKLCNSRSSVCHCSGLRKLFDHTSTTSVNALYLLGRHSSSSNKIQGTMMTNRF